MEFLGSLVVSESTKKTYASIMEHQILSRWTLDQLKEITADDAFKLVRAMHANGLSVSYIKGALTLIKQYLDSKEVPINLKRAYKQLGQYTYPKIKETLTPEELAKVLNLARKKDYDFYFFLLLASHTGMRKGEVIGLTAERFDFRRNRIIVSASHDNPFTKTKKARSVPMSNLVQEAALRYLQNKRLLSTERVFKLTSDPNKKFQVFCALAGISKAVTFHSLRHTFASLGLGSQKVTLKQMQELLGHSQLTTTLNMYWSSCPQVTDLSFLPGVTNE